MRGETLAVALGVVVVAGGRVGVLAEVCDLHPFTQVDTGEMLQL